MQQVPRKFYLFFKVYIQHKTDKNLPYSRDQTTKLFQYAFHNNSQLSVTFPSQNFHFVGKFSLHSTDCSFYSIQLASQLAFLSFTRLYY
jgi:hypothetical protein